MKNELRALREARIRAKVALRELADLGGFMTQEHLRREWGVARDAVDRLEVSISTAIDLKEHP